MAEPVRESTPGPGPPDWADVRRVTVSAVQACAAAAENLARHPGDPDALRVAELCAATVADAAEVTRGMAFSTQVLDDVWDRAFTAGMEACRAARGRMRVIRSQES
jgi:NAD(P)-dependent dehydrogenase (short-subunit alcohol dehydrogenase family)